MPTISALPFKMAMGSFKMAASVREITVAEHIPRGKCSLQINKFMGSKTAGTVCVRERELRVKKAKKTPRIIHFPLSFRPMKGGYSTYIARRPEVNIRT